MLSLAGRGATFYSGLLGTFRRHRAARKDAVPPDVAALSGGDGALQLDEEACRLLANPQAVWSVETLRFADTDLHGHITHPVVAALFQNGRALLLAKHAGRFSSPGMRWVTRTLSIDYRREIFWPGTAEIGTCVARLGGSSLHIEQDLLQENTSRATGRVVMVLMDTKTRRSTTIPAAMRRGLSKIVAGEYESAEQP